MYTFTCLLLLGLPLPLSFYRLFVVLGGVSMFLLRVGGGYIGRYRLPAGTQAMFLCGVHYLVLHVFLPFQPFFFLYRLL